VLLAGEAAVGFEMSLPGEPFPTTLRARLAQVPGKLRQRGFGWLVARILEECGIPARRTQHVLGGLRRRLTRRLLERESGLVTTRDRTLFAIYDLEYMPISYDVLWFLVWADLERRRLGMDHVHLVFVPVADFEALRGPPGYDSVIDANSREWRFENICERAPSLLQASSGLITCRTRDQLHALEIVIRHQVPNLLAPPSADFLQLVYRDVIQHLAPGSEERGLRASNQGLTYARGWLKKAAAGRHPIVITLRQYGFEEARNSSLPDWARFVAALDQRYCAIIVPDTDRAFEPYDEFKSAHVFREAAWNIGLRAALYELAYLNLFVNCGPASLCILNPRTRYLFFKIQVESAKHASEGNLRYLGFSGKETPAFATRFQRWVWESDSFEVLQREFESMVRVIEGY
jgi:hypothetical protein